MENVGMSGGDERFPLSPAVVFPCQHPEWRNSSHPGSARTESIFQEDTKTRAQQVAGASLTPSDAGQAAGIWGQQRKLSLNRFLSGQHQVIHALLQRRGRVIPTAAGVTATSPALATAGPENPGRQAAGGHDLLHGGDGIFKLTTSDLHLCFKSQAWGLHMPLSVVKQRWSR